MKLRIDAQYWKKNCITLAIIYIIIISITQLQGYKDNSSEKINRRKEPVKGNEQGKGRQRYTQPREWQDKQKDWVDIKKQWAH